MKKERLTIKDIILGLEKKSFSSVELTQFYLDQIDKKNPQINAFITVCKKEALLQAKTADKLLEKGIKKPLLGVPLAIKDIFLTKGIKTTAASKVLSDFIPVYDATVVAKLKEAGAIILGKTNMDAWAHGSSGENSDFGVTQNPWQKGFVPGGSSSGSAACVAADLAPAATGTDTGGSIRLPASFCNLVGLKPTYGRVSRYGIIAMSSSLDAIGHLTKTVYDSALLLNITAGKDKTDATTPKIDVPDYTQNLGKSIKGLKIGLPKQYFQDGLDKEVLLQTQKAIKVFQDLGANIVEIDLPHTKYALAVYYIIQPAEVSSNLARYDGIRYGLDRTYFGNEAKRRIMLGAFSLSSGYWDAYYLKAMQVRTLIKDDFENAFKKVDLILTPTSPTLPFKIGQKTKQPLQMYLSDIFTVTANLAGIPGLNLPSGFVNGLPTGIQLLGPQFSEDLLFQAGSQYEQKTNFYQKTK